MAADRVVVPDSWRLGLGVARAAIAVCLVELELYPQWYPLTYPAIVYLLYVAFSFSSILWERKDHGAADLMRLIIDLAVLLVCASYPLDRAGWALGIFYVYLLLSVSILHQLREIAMVVAIAVVFALLTVRDSLIGIGPIVLIPGLLALGLGWQRRFLEARLSLASKQSVLHRTEAENARELERQRIAADLHDGPLQSFISFQMRLEVIKKLLTRDRDAAIDDLTQLQSLCRKQITDMRSFVRNMRMSADSATPSTNIRQIAEDFQKTSGIQLTWSVSDALSGLEPEISHEVLQIIREALHNAQKHSKATRVTLQAEKADQQLQIDVQDDGSGFPFGGTYNLDELELMRIGPESIKRRVRTLNGELIVESIPGKGASLHVKVPV